MRGHSTVFSINDTIFRYGGYGYYSSRNSLEFYDLINNKWMYYPTSNSSIPRGCFYGFQFKKQNSVYLFGGKIINYSNGVTHDNNDEIIKFNSNKNKVEIVGKTNFDFKIREYPKNIFISSINDASLNRKIINQTLTSYQFIDNKIETINSVGIEKIISSAESEYEMLEKEYYKLSNIFYQTLIFILAFLKRIVHPFHFCCNSK